MSKYEYRCKKCGHRFEVVESISRHEKHPKAPCPKCKSRRVEQVPALFLAVTEKKA